MSADGLLALGPAFVEPSFFRRVFFRRFKLLPTHTICLMRTFAVCTILTLTC